MKTRIFLIIGILLLSCGFITSKEPGTGKGDVQKSSLKVFTSPDLYPLTNKWVTEYTKLNSGAKIELVTATEKDLSESLQSGGVIGFISDKSLSAAKNQFSWNMVVGRNVIVPIMNETNPLGTEIFKKGLTSQEIARLLKNPETENWGTLSGIPEKNTEHPVHYYYVNDPAIISGMSNFVNTKPLKLSGTQVASEQELISAIQKDVNGLGFCRLIAVTDQQSQSITSNLKLVPIDKNGNGKIDYTEAIYTNLQEFSRGVWIGKYPRALSGKIYSVASNKPKNSAEISFLNWVLTDGQQFLNTTGYSELVYNERQSQLEKINEPVVYATSPSGTNPVLPLKFLVILAIGVTILVLDLVTRKARNAKRAGLKTVSPLLKVIEEAAIIIPKGIYFDKTHTWAFMKKDGTVKVGIDDFLQHVTGPITRIEMKNTREKIKKGDHLLTIIQNGKQLKIYSPVTGEIVAHNANLTSHSGLINSAPFTEGWIYTIQPTNWSLEIQFMHMAEKYTNWLKTEYTRLRDFFEGAVRVHVPAFVMILQDGGVIKDGILADLGPEIWEDFQLKFIDTTR